VRPSRSVLAIMQVECQYVIWVQGSRTNDAAPHCPPAERVRRSVSFPCKSRTSFISIFLVAGTAQADAAETRRPRSQNARASGLRRTLESASNAAAPARKRCARRAAGQGAPTGTGRIFPRQAVTRWRIFGKPPPARDHPDHGNGDRAGEDCARRSIFVLANGQVWRQLDGATRCPGPAAGKTMKSRSRRVSVSSATTTSRSRQQRIDQGSPGEVGRLSHAPPPSDARAHARSGIEALRKGDVRQARGSRSNGSSRPARRMPPISWPCVCLQPASRTTRRPVARSIVPWRSSRAIWAR